MRVSRLVWGVVVAVRVGETVGVAVDLPVGVFVSVMERGKEECWGIQEKKGKQRFKCK